MKSIEVVAAIITQPDGRILCTQRNKGPYSYISKKYEFPGGKIEIGESKEEALNREILEELNIKIRINSFFITVEHQYPDFFLIMHTYRCNMISNKITLNDHLQYKWLELKNLRSLDWAAADLPIIDKLLLNEDE